MVEKIISMHIPKTAGTTFKSYLYSAYNNDVIVTSTKPLFTRCDELSNRDKLHLNTFNEHVVHGHFTFDEIEYNKEYFYITWLRDPVERVISHYFFWKNKPDINMHPIEKKIKYENLSLSEFAEIPCMRNIGLYFLGKEGVRKMNFIGITELFDESMQLLSKQLKNEFSMINIEKQRVNTQKEFVSDYLRKHIKDLNSEEFQLYYLLKKKIEEKR